MDDVAFRPAVALAKALRARELGSRELLERTIQVNGMTRPYSDQVAWAGVIGMALLPATVAPAGRTPEGLPVGVQLVGPYLKDRTPLDVARRLAEVIGGYEAPPGW